MKTFLSYSILILISGTLFLPAMPTICPESLPSICQDKTAWSALEVESEGREFQTQLLGHCPKNPGIARLLEKLILEDDSFVRAAAWKSLAKHLDAKTTGFLINLYFQEHLQKKEKELLYLYLSRLAGPEEKEAALPVFLRGLSSHSLVVRNASLVGIGAIRAPQAFSILKKILSKKDASQAELLAALEGLRRLKSSQSLALAKSLALHPNPAIQRKGLELLAERHGRLYEEAILELYLQGIHPKNQGLLFGMAHAILARLKKEYPSRQILYTNKTVLLHKSPKEGSAIAGSLGKYTILYSTKKSAFYYRKKAPHRNQDFSGRYLFVESSSGLSGWVHESGVAFFAYSKEF